MMAAVGVALAMSLAADPKRRWRQITFWPVPVILGAWACAIAACEFPRDVLGRSWGMVFYASLFFAAQVMAWRPRPVKGLALAALTVVGTMAIDLWWSQTFSRSLIRELPVSTKVWYAGPWEGRKPGLFLDRTYYGSQNNANDFAVVSILLPMTACVIPTSWTWGLWLLGAASSIYDVLIVKSRQLMLGLGVAICTQFGLRCPPRLRWWVVGGLIAILIVVVSAHPGTRARIQRSMSDPLTGRALVIAYGLDLYKNHPVFGVGPSLYGHYYVQGVREGWTFHGEELDQQGMPWVHSLPVEVACELGTVGLIGFGAVVWGAVRRVRVGLRRQGPTRDFAIAVTSASLAMAAISLIDLTFIKDWTRICWWLVLGLAFALPAVGTLGRASEAR
jgi:hypothetical protein